MAYTEEKELSFILNELGEDRDSYYNCIVPPIMQTTNFAIDTVDELREYFKDDFKTNQLYTRSRNPTVDILRKKLSALDHAEDCLVFNSGAAAILACIMSNVKSGDHIICVKNSYAAASYIVNEWAPRFGISTTIVDGKNIENFQKAIRPETKIIYLESPTSWTFELQDLKAIAELAKAHNILTICDNSYCSPLFQQPLALGIDLSIQSATKYIGGHSDTLGGVVSGKKEQIEHIFHTHFAELGQSIQPFNAWLLLRGLRTINLRMEKSAMVTRKIVTYLKGKERVEKVFFPFDEDYPQIELAKKQMKNACGLLSFQLRTTKEETMEVFSEAFSHIKMAVSWGGYESLILPGCAIKEKSAFDPSDPSQRTFRLYVGIENPDYLIEDFEKAFKQIEKLQ